MHNNISLYPNNDTIYMNHGATVIPKKKHTKTVLLHPTIIRATNVTET
jgi:hypothetical protein